MSVDGGPVVGAKSLMLGAHHSLDDAPPLDVCAAVHSLLAREGGVDALFSVNDWTTLACLHALNRAGVRVPEDVAVAGFADNDMVAAHLPVPILAIHQPRDDMGRRAAEILLRRIQGDNLVYDPAVNRGVFDLLRRRAQRARDGDALGR